ncbi:DUF2252 domain-containing protein [Actinacidiphila yeochonensis]|uniref:DUF2252 domain-containing protein n=1 Tax=Actinacidiphila yeochonensis TaxID=89050 RepID=UPI000A5376F2|nr:DUF2252 domain-containing protein [Actinacidiphila yeochonensis]
MPRSSHAGYEPASDRRDVVEMVEQQSAYRLQELVPIRYARMAESPFRFYRGAAAVMAEDLAGTPRTGIETQLCGDAHLLNFRLLASPERHMMFDINDFDETLPGPWEWDVKRFATSLVVAARANGFSAKERSRIVRRAVRAYRERMREFASMGNLAVWYSHVDEAWVRERFSGRVSDRARGRFERMAAKARGRDTLQAFDRLTEEVGGVRRIAADPPLLVPLRDLIPEVERRDREEVETAIRQLLERYGHTLASDRRFLLEQYRVADMARKVVGVGSVGTRCWIVLLLGRDGGDPLFLQAKEAGPSALAPFAGGQGWQGPEGERVVSGQRLMQATSDIFLGWERVDGIDGVRRDFYVRQLRDWKGIPEPERMVPDGMAAFAELCGATLARAHARSGDRIAIAAYLGGGSVFDEAVAEFAESYADQNERDHASLVAAIRSGRLPAADENPGALKPAKPAKPATSGKSAKSAE